MLREREESDMREKLNMNQGWKFFRGEIPYDLINGHFDTYMHSKAQSGRNAAAELFYDGNFESVQLPHDYVIEQEPSEDYNETQGGYNRENAWYRRSFLLKEEDKEKRILILFDGAGKNTEVWINGHPLGCNTSMYNSFFVDITPYVYYGENTNVLSVHIVNDGDLEGWWYEGAGIYRSVWMVKTARIAVDVWGIRLKPRRKDEHIWTLGMDLDLYNLDEEQDVIIKYELQEKTGRSILDGEQSARVLFGSNTFCFEMEVTDPILWNLESCELYRMVISICKDGKELDRSDASFGFRDIVFDADKGFFLNGKHIKLHGVCMHQDHGRLGVAVPSNILEYRISQLKKIGVNAYRCAHHNPAPELPDICDRLGMLVIDENRKFNFSDETQKQLKAMCYRDMNHPSVILWSVGNEEPLQHTKIGRNLVESMKKYIHRIDPLRPVTIALNGGFYDSYAAFASDMLLHRPDSDIRYIERMNKLAEEKAKYETVVVKKEGAAGGTASVEEKADPVTTAVLKGNKGTIIDEVKKAIADGAKPEEIINDQLIAAINKVGEFFEQKKYFLPQLIASANTMKLAIDYLEPMLEKKNDGQEMPTLVIATVEGDIHDIGKNLVVLMLKNYGYNVIDMGKDVPCEDIVDTAIRENAAIIGLSALMTTTMMRMQDVVELCKEKGCKSKVIIGGACITQSFADEIGADGYSKDAAECVRLVERLLA